MATKTTEDWRPETLGEQLLDVTYDPDEVAHLEVTGKNRDGVAVKPDAFSFVPGADTVVKLRYRDDPLTRWSIRSGEVQLADGTRAYAVLMFCDSDSGEHYGTWIFTPDGPWDQHEGGTPMGKPREDVFPYRYRYDGSLIRDYHIGPNGWSR